MIRLIKIHLQKKYILVSDPILFFDCGIHAREWISSATCLFLIQELCVCYQIKKYPKNPFLNVAAFSFSELNRDFWEWKVERWSLVISYWVLSVQKNKIVSILFRSGCSDSKRKSWPKKGKWHAGATIKYDTHRTGIGLRTLLSERSFHFSLQSI